MSEESGNLTISNIRDVILVNLVAFHIYTNTCYQIRF